MRDDNLKKSKKLSWSKTFVRKWFNIKSKSQEFYADEDAGQERSSKKNVDRVRRGRFDLNSAQVTDTQDYKIFVATWNVGGKSPPRNLNLEDWLHASPADIYVLGFQEVVPLNAGNVLGTEDNEPAKEWLRLIRKALNNLPGTSGCGNLQTPSRVTVPIVELDADFEGSSTRQTFYHRRSFHSLSRSSSADDDIMIPQPQLNRRSSVSERINFGSRPSDFDSNFRCEDASDDECAEESVNKVSPSTVPYEYDIPMYMEERDRLSANSRYCLVASKQMVGIFLTIWVRSEVRDDVKNLKVSCVGRGLMGYLGNKGSISISMSLHQTSFCFICSHLTSGEKEGDEIRRNSDVVEILRKTRFPWVRKVGNDKSPETILEHDRIIWLGDLNYRVALSYRSAKALVEMYNWRALLEKDQLQIEQRRGRVFQGWKEGKIYFPPTYKYLNNSDHYAGEGTHTKRKRRKPAWCDRILWYGQGISQLSYVRGESRFSDHRPVYSIFKAEVEMVGKSRIKRSTGYPSSRVQVEELLPYPNGCFIELGFRRKFAKKIERLTESTLHKLTGIEEYADRIQVQVATSKE